MKIAKQEISEAVKEYKKVFYPEYLEVVELLKAKRKALEDKDYATVVKDSGSFLDRALTEIPETLYTVLLQGLSKESLKYYKSKEGTRWFAREFPEFRLGKKI